MSCVYKNPCDGSPKSAGSACNQYNHDLPQPNPCKTHRPKGIDSKACDLFIHDMVEKRIGNGGGRLLALEDFLRSQIQRGTLPPIQRARGLSSKRSNGLKHHFEKLVPDSASHIQGLKKLTGSPHRIPPTPMSIVSCSPFMPRLRYSPNSYVTILALTPIFFQSD